MKRFLLTIFMLAGIHTAFATHTKGGWMYYEYLGRGINDTTKLRYRIGLNFYMSCTSSVLESSYNLSIFNAVSPFGLVMHAPVTVGTDVNIQNCLLQSC